MNARKRIKSWLLIGAFLLTIDACTYFKNENRNILSADKNKESNKSLSDSYTKSLQCQLKYNKSIEFGSLLKLFDCVSLPFTSEIQSTLWSKKSQLMTSKEWDLISLKDKDNFYLISRIKKGNLLKISQNNKIIANQVDTLDFAQDGTLHPGKILYESPQYILLQIDIGTKSIISSFKNDGTLVNSMIIGYANGMKYESILRSFNISKDLIIKITEIYSLDETTGGQYSGNSNGGYTLVTSFSIMPNGQFKKLKEKLIK